jgi:alpha-1,6-mannosyltransferase
MFSLRRWLQQRSRPGRSAATTSDTLDSNLSSVGRAVARIASAPAGLCLLCAPAFGALFLIHLANSLPALRAGAVPPDLGQGAAAGTTLQALQIVCLAYLFAVYGLVLRYWRYLQVRPRALACTALVAAVMVAALLPANSSDVLEYVGFGRLVAVYHANPYLHTYAEITDGFARSVTWNEPMPYGPVILPIVAAAGAVSRHGVVLAIYTLKLAWLLVFLLNGFLIYRLAGRSGWLEPEQAFFVFAFNPLLLIEQLGNGHNDGLLILGVLLALYALDHGSDALALALAFLSALVKTPGLFWVAAIAVLLVRRRRWRSLLAGAGACLTGLLVVIWLLPGCLTTLTAMDDQWRFSENSLHTIVIGWGARLISAMRLTWDYQRLFMLDRWTFSALFLAFGVWRLTAIRDRASVIRQTGYLLLVLLLGFAASVSPWYATWLLPIAALTDSDTLRRTILVTSGAVLLLYAFPYRWVEPAQLHTVWSTLRLLLAFGTPIAFWCSEREARQWAQTGSALAVTFPFFGPRWARDGAATVRRFPQS